MDYRFTVGADESFPLPPSASSLPSGLVAGAAVPLKVFTAASYSSGNYYTLCCGICSQSRGFMLYLRGSALIRCSVC